MNKVFYFSFPRVSYRKNLIPTVFVLVTLFTSCTYEATLQGVVIDEVDRLPVSNAQVRTLQGVDGRTLDFIDVHTDKAGKFETASKSNRLLAEKLWVEGSKEYYLTNMYTVSQNSFDSFE